MTRRPARSRPRRKPQTAPGEIVRGRAESLGARADALVRLESGAGVFVPGLLPGEEAFLEVSGDRGRVIERFNDAPERIEPGCPLADPCGGCALQHFEPDAYAAWKRGLLVEALSREGLKAEIGPLVQAWGEGRRRIGLHALRLGRRLIVGFSQRAGDRLVDAQDCPAAVSAIRRAFPGLRTLAGAVTPAKGRADIAVTATETGLDISVAGAAPPDLAARETIAALAYEHDWARVTVGADPVIERVRPEVSFGAARVCPPPGGFLQATAAGEAVLAGHVEEALKGAGKAADLYCGSGAFALRLARSMPVLAAEADEASLAALEHAAARTPGLKPVRTRLRNLVKEPISAGELAGIDAAVVDPPRGGADAQMRMLAASGVSRIAAVSCNPKTFARDAAILLGAGFSMGPVTPVDQFRWTGHVELFCLFSRHPA